MLWIVGKHGSGLEFNGSDDYVDVGSSSSLDVPATAWGVSVEMWVNLDAGGQTDTYPMPFNKGGHSTTVPGYYMGAGHDGNEARKMKFGISDGTTGGTINSPSTDTLNEGQWHHLVGYADMTTGKIGLFKDGTLVGENTIPGSEGSISNLARAAMIGGNGTANSFKGKIDGVRIYKKALSTSEVQARYAAQPEEEATVHYYLGDKEVAFKKGTTLEYIHQDHLTGTSVVSDSSGNQVSAIRYLPFGSTRSGSAPTDKQFTGQRLDGTGLYYYGARYYDPSIGKFISGDTFVPIAANPQYLNRYSYALNSPSKYIDPSGNFAFAIALVPVAIPIGKMLIAAGAAAAAVLVVNVLGSRRNPYIRDRIPIPDIKIPTPNEQNLWPGGSPKLGPLGKAILIGIGTAYVLERITGTSEDNPPQLPAGKEEPVPTTTPKPATPPQTTESGTSTSSGYSFSATLGAGGESYNSSTPTPVGDTGSTNWGTTSSGAQVISMNDPNTYEPWEWW